MGVGTTIPLTALHVNGFMTGSTIGFHAVSTHSTYGYSSGTIITSAANQGWNSIIHNVGNCWNGTTGYFTPTTSGYYVISANAYNNSTAGFSIRKNATTSTNGTELGGGFATTGVSCYSAATVFVYLNGSSDNISVWAVNNGVGISNSPGNCICAFLLMPA